jgi:hypothetical protein
VTGAIFAGGPGAVFWMWVSAFFGMCTKYAEIALAMKYRVTDENGVHNSLTEIYRFDIIDSGAVFAGSYSVDGLLSDAPFVSTENGNLIALATEQQSTTLYVLDKDMQLTGKLEGIFPGERIKNFLCFDTKCYVVAGEENETTLIIDLSDPENPVEEETLSTDGFATMLYKAGDNLFLRINVFDTDG